MLPNPSCLLVPELISDFRCVDRVFVHALNTVKRIPRTGSARPPPSDRLKLYGLYKQSTEGDVEGLSRRPDGSDQEAIAERDKWYQGPQYEIEGEMVTLTRDRDAWHAHHGLSRTEAKRRYITILIETMHKYATTTPEARELVSELEFVWDQIRSNSGSSAASSPSQILRGQSQQITNPSFIGVSGRMDDDDGGGLRVLRPVSDGDEEGEDLEEDEFREARGDAFDNDEDVAPETRDLDVRNRKWKKRIEKALVKMTTEVAALREQIEAKRIGEGKRRNGGIWTWMVWLVWIAIRHALLDLAVLGLLVVWARRKRDRRVEMGLGLLVQYITEQTRKLLRPLRLPTQPR